MIVPPKTVPTGITGSAFAALQKAIRRKRETTTRETAIFNIELRPPCGDSGARGSKNPASLSVYFGRLFQYFGRLFQAQSGCQGSSATIDTVASLNILAPSSLGLSSITG